MTDFEMITVRIKGGEQITMTATDVQWFSRDGLCVGHASMEEFLDFLKETLADMRFTAKMEHAEQPDFQDANGDRPEDGE